MTDLLILLAASIAVTLLFMFVNLRSRTSPAMLATTFVGLLLSLWVVVLVFGAMILEVLRG